MIELRASAKSSPAIERGRRNAELGAIHVGAKRLGFDDDTYREFLFRITGRRSAAELDAAGRARVIEEMRQFGFRRTPAAEKLARRMADDRQLAMIHGVWRQLQYAGALKDASERHLSAFIKKMTGIERAEWLAPEEAVKVIEGLKAWRDRAVAKAVIAKPPKAL
jgi:phage gp16-like protein